MIFMHLLTWVGFGLVGYVPNTLYTDVQFLPEILDHSVLAGQVEEVEEEPQSLGNLPGLHAEDPAEVHHRLLDCELSVQGNLLGHVADAFPWHSRP
jgi:hypothetical protein